MIKEDEYIKDGLIYCKKCNKPRQMVLTIGSTIHKMHVMCPCQKAEFDKKEVFYKQIEFKQEVERIISKGLPDKTLYSYTFANDSGINTEI